MHPKEAIQEDLKVAMKSGDVPRREALRLLLAAFKQVEVDQRKQLSEDEAIAVLMSEAKKRRETIEEMERAARPDLADQERFELTVTEHYLPRQLTEEEIRQLAEESIAEVNAESARDIGSVMRVLMPRVQGQADGKRVSAIVRELLG